MADNTLEMPDAIKKAIETNPELLKHLANPAFINSINDQLAKAGANADWCVACGASSSKAKPTRDDLINPPTTEEIKEIGKRLMSITS